MQVKRRILRKTPNDRIRSLREYLEGEIWSQIPSHILGKREREAILGIGAEGYPER